MARSLTDVLTTVQQGVTAVNGLSQILTQATTNSSSLRVTIKSTIFLTSSAITNFSTTVGTVTTVNTSIGLTGGPITTSGTIAVSLSALTNSLTSDHNLNNTATYFDGPTVTQGTSGVWWVSGSVVISDTVGSNQTQAKLWDGTTVIDSVRGQVPGVTNYLTLALSGFITNPAGDLRISANDTNTTTGVMKFNITGNSKDSTISAIRIG